MSKLLVFVVLIVGCVFEESDDEEEFEKWARRGRMPGLYI